MRNKLTVGARVMLRQYSLDKLSKSMFNSNNVIYRNTIRYLMYECGTIAELEQFGGGPCALVEFDDNENKWYVKLNYLQSAT